MVEGDLVERGAGREGGDVAAQAVVPPVGVHHHRHGVPPDVTLDAHFRFPIAGEGGLLREGDGVDVRRADGNRRGQARGAQRLGNPVQEQRRSLRPLLLQGHLEQRLDRSQHLLLVAADGRRLRLRRRPVRLFLILMFHLIAQFNSDGYSSRVLRDLENWRRPRHYGQADDSQS